MPGLSPKRTDKQMSQDQKIQKLKKALRASNRVLNDWIITHASECCSEEQIGDARRRLMVVGTLAYVAHRVSENRELIEEA